MKVVINLEINISSLIELWERLGKLIELKLVEEIDREIDGAKCTICGNTGEMEIFKHDGLDVPVCCECVRKVANDG